MPAINKQGLLKRSTLTKTEIAEIEELVTLCNKHDGLHMRIPPEALHQRSSEETNDFLYYEQGMLVGYLYVDSWGRKVKEMTGMVHPEFRRRGVFLQLFEAAYAECKERGVERMLLLGEHSSHSGHAFAQAVKAHYDFSEHEMVLGEFVARQEVDPEFQVNRATVKDKESIISIVATDIEDNEEDARRLVEELYADPKQQIYLATLAGKVLGCLRLDYRTEWVGIYGFVIRPEYRGHGYGRQMLEYMIRHIRSEGSREIVVEADTMNLHAVRLYTSCGFRVRTTYDYFNRDI